MIANQPWRALNLLKRPAAAGPAANARQPSAAGTTAELEHARKINLKFAANLPNFTADETAKRYTSRANPPEWKSEDTIESEVAFKGNNAVRRHILRNGKPWDQVFTRFQASRGLAGSVSNSSRYSIRNVQPRLSSRDAGRQAGSNYWHTVSSRRPMHASAPSILNSENTFPRGWGESWWMIQEAT
jgi:hypothetical protein